jgi:serine/threonine protein kinase
LADFGLTSEGTSQALRRTELGRGTEGYRAPEILREDQNGYNNKSDIWAMGCILYELAVGQKMFRTDHAVQEFDRLRRPKEIVLNEAFNDECRTQLISTVNIMVKSSVSSRPAASALVKRFSGYHEQSQNKAGVGNRNQDQSPDGAVNHVSQSQTPIPEGRKSASCRLLRTEVLILPKPEAVEEFNDTEWTIFDTAVNKSNARLLTSSFDDGRLHFRVQLWDTASGQQLWFKQESRESKSWLPPVPKFSEDGDYFAVYLGDLLEVLDVHSVTPVASHNKLGPGWGSSHGPQALSICRKGKAIAFWFEESNYNDRPPPPTAVLKRHESRVDKDRKAYFDLVSTVSLTNVVLNYVDNARRLSLDSPAGTSPR